MPAHTAAFAAVRELILEDLSDDGRKRLAALLGCMTEPLPRLSPDTVRALRAILALSGADRDRLSDLCRWAIPLPGRYSCHECGLDCLERQGEGLIKDVFRSRR